MHFKELRSGHAHPEDRHRGRPLRDVLDELEDCGVCPLQVIDDHQDRLLGGQRLDMPADRPRQLGIYPSSGHLGDGRIGGFDAKDHREAPFNGSYLFCWYWQ